MSEERPVLPAERRIQAGLYFLMAAIAAAVGIPLLLQGACPSCTGLLSLVLPGLGAAFYAALGVLAWKSPTSPHLTNALSFAVFVHACLVAEMLLLGRLCMGCLSIAGLAVLAAGLRAWRVADARLPLLAGLLLGGAAGFVYPFDRVEDNLTRRLWPAHILSQAPAFVDRQDLAACAHRSQVRLLTYEDERTCQSCRGLAKRLLPQLAKDFPETLCVHTHLIHSPAPGQVLPVLIFLSRKNRLVVSEGVPEYDVIRDMLREMIRESGGAE